MYYVKYNKYWIDTLEGDLYKPQEFNDMKINLLSDFYSLIYTIRNTTLFRVWARNLLPEMLWDEFLNKNLKECEQMSFIKYATSYFTYYLNTTKFEISRVINIFFT